LLWFSSLLYILHCVPQYNTSFPFSFALIFISTVYNALCGPVILYA
jgi:hypothetical protein